MINVRFSLKADLAMYMCPLCARSGHCKKGLFASLRRMSAEIFHTAMRKKEHLIPDICSAI